MYPVILSFLSRFTGLPYPTFGRVVIRKTTATILEDLSKLFGEEAETFLGEVARSQFNVVSSSEKLEGITNRDEKRKERRLKKIGGDWLAIAVRLLILGVISVEAGMPESPLNLMSRPFVYWGFPRLSHCRARCKRSCQTWLLRHSNLSSS